MLLSTAERLSHPAPIVMIYRGALTNDTDTEMTSFSDIYIRFLLIKRKNFYLILISLSYCGDIIMHIFKGESYKYPYQMYSHLFHSDIYISTDTIPTCSKRHPKVTLTTVIMHKDESCLIIYIHQLLKEGLIFGICQFKLQHRVFVSDFNRSLTPPHCWCIINQQTDQTMVSTSCAGSPCAESPCSPWWVSIISLPFISSVILVAI